MKHGKNATSKQATYRGVDCPACGVKAGDYCKSMGLRGKAAGNVMGTSCHDARIKASGNVPRSVLRSKQRTITAKARGAKRHQAGKKAWQTRMAHQRLKQASQRYQSLVTGPVTNIGLSELIQTVVSTLEVGATSVTASVNGVGEVHGENRGKEVWLKIVRG